MTLCLAMQGVASQLSVDSGWEYLKQYEKREFNRVRAELNDPVKLKKYLITGELPANPAKSSFGTSFRGCTGKEMAAFKRIFELKEETVRTTLMSVIREETAKTGWQESHPQVCAALSWLGVYADVETKQFLMDVFKDAAKGDGFRRIAIFSYLQAADAQEVKDALAYLFADEMKALFNDCYPLYQLVTQDIYDAVEDDPQKQAAIVTTVSAALTKEEDREVFLTLVNRSKEYEESLQRKAALKRMNIQPLKDPVRNKPVKNKSVPWKLPLLIGTLILGGAVMWRKAKQK